MKNGSPVSLKLTLIAAAIAIALCSGSVSFAQTDSQSGADRATETQIKVLKGKIDNLQAQLGKLESLQHGHAASPGAAAANGGKDCCAGGAPSSRSGMTGSNVSAPEGLAQASPASEPSPDAGSEHPMGGGGMGGSVEHGEGMMGAASASPAASPGAMPMEEHLKGMEHMHGMMHGSESGASPAASPGAMPMEHGMPMEHNMGEKTGEGMGGMGGGGMGGERMQGGTGGGAQPEASPSAGMGGMKDDM